MKIKTTRRRILVRITSEQIHRRNHILLPNGKELKIVDKINPNNWSVEEAIIEWVPDNHSFYKQGDRVLIDFSVLTHGMYPEMQMTDVTRIVEQNTDYTILWCYCGADDSSATEIHAKIQNEDGVEILVPFPGTILIPALEKPTENFQQCGLLYVPAKTKETRDNTFKSSVLFSGIKDITDEDFVWVKGGHSVEIISGNWKIEYVDRASILALA